MGIIRVIIYNIFNYITNTRNRKEEENIMVVQNKSNVHTQIQNGIISKYQFIYLFLHGNSRF